MIETQADRGRICSDGHTCHIPSGSEVAQELMLVAEARCAPSFLRAHRNSYPEPSFLLSRAPEAPRRCISRCVKKSTSSRETKACNAPMPPKSVQYTIDSAPAHAHRPYLRGLFRRISRVYSSHLIVCTALCASGPRHRRPRSSRGTETERCAKLWSAGVPGG